MDSTVAPVWPEERDFIDRTTENGFVMAVTVHQNVRACETAEDEIRHFCREPVGKEPNLLAHTLRTRVVGEKFEKFIFENAGATRFKKDERQAGFNCGACG